MKSSMFLIALSPMTWAFILAIVFLLFGAGRLPKLARALGESKRALKEGLSDQDAGKL
jgi:TatA/E family protein of Tat protein translocase